MTCICFCHYGWLLHFIVELIILIIAFPCTYKQVIGECLLTSIGVFSVFKLAQNFVLNEIHFRQ